MKSTKPADPSYESLKLNMHSHLGEFTELGYGATLTRVAVVLASFDIILLILWLFMPTKIAVCHPEEW